MVHNNYERIVTMDNANCSTEHRKGQHLSRKERYEIKTRLKDKRTVYRIAKELGRPYYAGNANSIQA